ncbi:MAG TPA: ATP-binding protein [Thermoanaerobaculales bacterium]|nr:ATP-binding protein [Thermoanaerobaculales bacterium]HQL30871.1 ATP-binding protein [Thermoanaerobaculales bacterium]
MIRLGLRSRFFLYSNTVIAVTMVLVTFLWMVHARRSLHEAFIARGRSIVDAMASPMTVALEGSSAAVGGGAPETASTYIAEVLSRNPDFVRYVIVSDVNGHVTHASSPDLVGQHFDRPLGPGSIGAPPEVAIREDRSGERLLEVRTALDGTSSFLGSLAVGFSLDPIELRVAAVIRYAALVGVVLMLFNSAMTALYVETLIRPILTLNETMKRAGLGDLGVRAAAGGGDEVGELSGAFNRMMDELQAAREREKAQRTQLAQADKMAAVGTLAAGVAHEVNNPLAGVTACLENLRANPDDDEMRSRYLDLIGDGLARIERTITNLLNFSRQREVKLEPTSLNHSLRHVVELVGYQLRQAGVQVAFDLDADQAMVMADHFQMEQLFLNLVLNAIGAMPEGGALTLKTRVGRGEVTVDVKDTGTGIPEEIRGRVFDPFFTTREAGEGTGLGLAVSHSIVAAHGGTIEVESVPGAGTTFRVHFAAMAGGAAARGGR